MYKYEALIISRGHISRNAPLPHYILGLDTMILPQSQDVLPLTKNHLDRSKGSFEIGRAHSFKVHSDGLHCIVETFQPLEGRFESFSVECDLKEALVRNVHTPYLIEGSRLVGLTATNRPVDRYARIIKSFGKQKQSQPQPQPQPQPQT